MGLQGESKPSGYRTPFGSNPKPSPSRDGNSGRRSHIRPGRAPLAQRQSTWLLPRGSGYRNSGGVPRAGTVNWPSGSPQKRADVGSTPTSRTGAGWDDWPPSRTLNPAHAGSNPAPAAAPSHTACDLAPVRQETRVGTGWRLHVLVLQLGERSARDAGCCGFESRRAHDALRTGVHLLLVKAAARLGTGEGLLMAGWPVGRGDVT